MAIERHGFERCNLVCDNCGDELDEHAFDDFQEMMQARKDAGWITGKGLKTKQWFNLCPSCAECPQVIYKFKEKV